MYNNNNNNNNNKNNKNNVDLVLHENSMLVKLL
jgi:hypothetical protein